MGRKESSLSMCLISYDVCLPIMLKYIEEKHDCKRCLHVFIQFTVLLKQQIVQPQSISKPKHFSKPSSSLDEREAPSQTPKLLPLLIAKSCAKPVLHYITFRFLGIIPFTCIFQASDFRCLLFI